MEYSSTNSTHPLGLILICEQLIDINVIIDLMDRLQLKVSLECLVYSISLSVDVLVNMM